MSILLRFISSIFLIPNQLLYNCRSHPYLTPFHLSSFTSSLPHFSSHFLTPLLYNYPSSSLKHLPSLFLTHFFIIILLRFIPPTLLLILTPLYMYPPFVSSLPPFFSKSLSLLHFFIIILLRPIPPAFVIPYP